MATQGRPFNWADRVAIFLGFLVGPALWIITGNWVTFAVPALVGVTIGVCWGTPPTDPRSRVRESKHFED